MAPWATCVDQMDLIRSMDRMAPWATCVDQMDLILDRMAPWATCVDQMDLILVDQWIDVDTSVGSCI